MDFNHCLHDSIFLMTIPELIAVITGVASVWFARKENILVFPVGIVSVLLYVYICLQVHLYADALINFYYFILSVYGWYFWKHGGRLQAADDYKITEEIDSVSLNNDPLVAQKEEAEIGYNSLLQNIYMLAGTAVLGILIGFLLDNYTDSNVPYWDGITSGIFCFAMILMARKKIENWVLWVIGDAMCIPLFLYKGLCLSALQYAIFMVLAIAGYIAWYKKLEIKFFGT